MKENASHKLAALQREAGDSNHALKTYEEAYVEYTTTQEWEGVVRVLLEKAIVFLHQFDQDSQSRNLAQALINLRQADDLIQTHQLSQELQSLWAVGMGNTLSRSKQWDTAAEHFHLAANLETSVWARANYSVHEAYARHKNGSASASIDIENSLQLLRTPDAEIDDTTRRTWLSGALLKHAEVLKNSPEILRQLLAEAEAVIMAEPQLPVRATQLVELKKKLLR